MKADVDKKWSHLNILEDYTAFWKIRLFDTWENSVLMKWDYKDRRTEQEDLPGNKNKTLEIMSKHVFYLPPQNNSSWNFPILKKKYISGCHLNQIFGLCSFSLKLFPPTQLAIKTYMNTQTTYKETEDTEKSCSHRCHSKTGLEIKWNLSL